MFSHYTENKFPAPDHFIRNPFSNPRSRWHPKGSKFQSEGDPLSKGVPPVREGEELRRKIAGRRILT